MNDNPLAADILQGADAIAAWTGFKRRAIYHAVACGHIPTFRMGEIICARKSTLNRWVSEQEARAAA